MSIVIIADSHGLCREALCRYIRQAGEGIDVVGAGDYEALMRHASARFPDLVLMSADLTRLEGKNVGAFPIGWRGDEMVTESANIRGHFPKYLSSKDILQGIYKILAGEKFFPEESHPDNKILPLRTVLNEFHLSQRERDVAAFLLKGASNKEIARALNLQVVTIKLHVRGICRKLEAANRTQAAMIIKEHQLV